MKATLTFNLPDDEESFNYAVKGAEAHFALSDVRDEIFRPARKHGYGDLQINALMDKLGDDAVTLIGHLEDRFGAILFDHNIDLQ